MKTPLALLALTLAVQPVLAQPVNTMMILRDSDGIVISVLHPINYFTPHPGTGGVMYTMGGIQVDFSKGADGVTTATTSTATVGATTYKVEVSGNDVYLRDPVTGLRYATERRVAAVPGGLQVNPTGFALD